MRPRKIGDYPELLTVEELAQVLRCGRSKAYEIARRLRVPGLSVVRIPRRVLEEMISGEQTSAVPLRAVGR